ncbi:Down syndrome critical region protein 3 [Hondaea fermentalgiana]|uniref:Down syndrome critical region protein 3 n=1 Tax=Hondaea fermentalgiana TaxID=2315210 RepID=A0A2R5GFG9_9STRA|nr:Down syndrome critical region protein 3 [Hondaea fermentalgiana]|eukprot:GBG29666.1 Down syndrome critical region protein 3 [Hondaea fermentalgiana]
MNVNSVRLVLEGASRLHLNARNVGLLEAFYSSIQPQVFMEKEMILARNKRVQAGETSIPFSFVLDSKPGLQETYHGVYITTAYVLRVEAPRGLLSSTLSHEQELIVEIPGAGEGEEVCASRAVQNPSGSNRSTSAENVSTVRSPSERSVEPTVRFEITPASLENVDDAERSRIPRFAVLGHLDRLRCPLTCPLSGEVQVDVSEMPIQSIDLQLVRVESIEYAEGIAKEATEIQSLQIASGDVCREMAIPIHMPFPKLFTCASMRAQQFRVDFEINLLVTLGDNTIITESFPLQLYRPSL